MNVFMVGPGILKIYDSCVLTQQESRSQSVQAVISCKLFGLSKSTCRERI